MGSSSNSDDESPDRTPAPDSSRHTSHTGKQSGISSMGYGCMVAWHHLRPFIPFFLISFMVVALVYLMQAIIYGGPFKDPFFFVKFNERWPRPTPGSPTPTKVFSPIPSSSFEQVLVELHRDNETTWTLWLQKVEELFSLWIWAAGTLQGLHQYSELFKGQTVYMSLSIWVVVYVTDLCTFSTNVQLYIEDSKLQSIIVHQ